MPTMASLLRTGAKSADGGLLTRGSAQYWRGLVQPIDRRLAGCAWFDQQYFSNQWCSRLVAAPASFDAGVLQAESLAQAAERGGKKVAQIEWAGGRNGAINGPTVDYHTFFSGRGVATNYIGADDDAAFVASFGLQFDHPAGFAGQAPFPAPRPPVRPAGLMCRNRTARPKKCACASSISVWISTA